jgi:hypothetical protein
MFDNLLSINRFVPINTSILETMPTKGKWSKRTTINRLVVHCNDNGDWGPVDTANYHISPDCHIKNMKGIAYHVFIDTKGDVWKTSEYDNKTWHVGFWNSGSLAVCLQYRGTHNLNPPNSSQLASLHTTLAGLCLGLGIEPTKANIVGHRELQYTGWINNKDNLLKTCPGMGVDLDKVRKNTVMYIQKVLRDVSLVPGSLWIAYQGKIDGDYGPKTRESFLSFGRVRGSFFTDFHKTRDSFNE